MSVASFRTQQVWDVQMVTPYASVARLSLFRMAFETVLMRHALMTYLVFKFPSQLLTGIKSVHVSQNLAETATHGNFVSS